MGSLRPKHKGVPGPLCPTWGSSLTAAHRDCDPFIGLETPVTGQMQQGPRARPRDSATLAAPLLLTCTIRVKETVPLAMVTEKGGTRTGGSPLAISPVRMKGWYPVTSKEYATRAAKETTRALRAGTEGTQVRPGPDTHGKVAGQGLAPSCVQTAACAPPPSAGVLASKKPFSARLGGADL